MPEKGAANMVEKNRRIGADSIEGVPLAQYAAVIAALAEDFPLPEILAVEGLSAGAWSRAMSAWKQTLVSDGLNQGPLFESYKIELGRAEDRLARRIKPLDEDLFTWTAFLKIWSAHPSPPDLLAKHKLRMNDLGRLTRRWSSRLEADPSLKKKAASLAKDSRPAELPPITAEPSVLRPSAAARAAKSEPALADAGRDGDFRGISLDQFASLTAELEAFPDDHERIYGLYGLTDAAARAACERAWRTRLANDPNLHRDWKSLTAHYRRQRRAAPPRALPGVEPPRPPPILVFSQPIQPDIIEPIKLAPEPPRPSKAADHKNPPKTADMPVFLEPTAPVLPFVARAPKSTRKSGKGAPESKKAPKSMRAPKSGRGPASSRAPESRKAPKSTKSPRSVRAPGSIRAPASESAPATLPSPGKPRGPVLPFAQKSTPKSPAAEQSPSIQLTLEQHASLWVELTLRPDQEPAILARYHLKPDQKDPIDRHWRARIAKDPALRDAWNRAFSQYRDWVLAQNPRKR